MNIKKDLKVSKEYQTYDSAETRLPRSLLRISVKEPEQ